MKATAQMLFVLGMFLAPAEVIAASCSSYYISEITLVSPGDTEAGVYRLLSDLEHQRKRPRRTPWGRARISSLTFKHAWTQIASWAVMPLRMRLTARFI